MPGSCRTAAYPLSPASRSAACCPSRAISASSTAISARSEATLAAYGAGSTSWSSQVPPPRPKMSVRVTAMPHLASTACTWSLQEVRWPTSLCRYAEARIMPIPGLVARPMAVAGVETSA